MAVRYWCPKCDRNVQFSPADDEEDPHQGPRSVCPGDQRTPPWDLGVLAAVALGVLASLVAWAVLP